MKTTFCLVLFFFIILITAKSSPAHPKKLKLSKSAQRKGSLKKPQKARQARIEPKEAGGRCSYGEQCRSKICEGNTCQ